MEFKMPKSLKEEYFDMICDRFAICREDLSEMEENIIEYTFSILKEKLNDITDRDKEIAKMKIDMKNMKIFIDDVINDDKEEDED